MNWKRLIEPLRSRKVRVALVTVIAAFGAEYGFEIRQELLLTILGVGISIILGIAHEDNGRNASGNVRGEILTVERPEHRPPGQET